MIRIFTIEYDPIKKGFDSSNLEAFLTGKSVICIEKRFFKHNSKFYWTFAIEYEVGKADKSKEMEFDTDDQKALFAALREWRNELAFEKGFPAYLIFTNNQLKQIVLSKPTNLEELKNTNTISSKKAEEYHEAITKITKENPVDEQKPSVPDLRPVD